MTADPLAPEPLAPGTGTPSNGAPGISTFEASTFEASTFEAGTFEAGTFEAGARHEVALPPYRLVALVAPAMDRIFLGTTLAGQEGCSDLARRYGGREATEFLVELRTRLAAPGGTVTDDGLTSVTRYRDPAACRRTLDKHLAHGTVVRHGDGFRATARGLAFLDEVYALHARVTGDLWTEHRDRVARLVDTLGRLLAAAADNGGDAFAATAPPYEPDGTPPGVLLLNRLGALRYHRADAHAAACTAAGHTARTIVELPAGAERLAIEQETDRRAAGPYQALTASERLLFLADLAALPA